MDFNVFMEVVFLIWQKYNFLHCSDFSFQNVLTNIMAEDFYLHQAKVAPALGPMSRPADQAP